METKPCWQCVHFCSLFKRADYQFFVFELGYCSKQSNLVDRYGCCECWQEKEKQETVTPRVLKRVVCDLQEIKLILQEETERIDKK